MKKDYHKNYYKQHRDQMLKKAREKYNSLKKKTPKCKMCGEEIKGAHGSVKYCQKCLFSPGHGADAHRMAAVRWFRKNHLTNAKKSGSI